MPTNPDISALVSDLEEAVGKPHVLHAPEDLLAYEYDATIDRHAPDVVVFPVTTDQAAAVRRPADRAHGPCRGQGAAQTPAPRPPAVPRELFGR